MAKRSLKASPTGIIQAKRAFELTGWTQEYLAAEVGLSTRQSVWKFFTGKPVERHIFIDLCFQLDLEWEDIADLPQKSKSLSSHTANNTTSLNSEDLLTIARDRIQGQIQAQCSTVQSFFEYAQPLKLDAIYTNLNLLTHLTSQRWLEVSDLQNNNHSERLDFSHNNSQSISAISAVNNHDKLVLLGKPGAGKTTFLQYLALQCIQGKFKPDCLPVFIFLRTFVHQCKENNNFSIINYLQNLWANYDLAPEQIVNLLQQGKVLILLDGLDEIPQNYEVEILSEIQQFSEVYYQNPIIITCRLAGQQYRFNGFTYLEVADFNQEQVATFAQKWFMATANNPETGATKSQQFLEQLRRKENLPIRELVTTPILLNLICSVFQERLSFPTKRARLYQEGLDILLLRWDRSRGIERDIIYQNLSLPDKIKLLSHIAAYNFQKGNFFFEKQEFIQTISDYLLTLPDTNRDPETLRLDSEAILKAIEVQHGLLVERARGVYSFSHLTFQEYLTSRKIVSSSTREELHQNLQYLASKIFNPQWCEVILLTVSELPNADYLIQQLKIEIDSFIQKESYLPEFLQFIDTKANSLSLPYKSAAVRAFYFSLFHNRDLNLAITLDGRLANNLDNELALDLALERAFAMAETLMTNPTIQQIINFSFSLDLESSFSLSSKMKQALSNLKQKLPEPTEGKEKILAWWNIEGKDWLVLLRRMINDFRYEGTQWDFTIPQQKILQQYYVANQFFLECLHSNCKLLNTTTEEQEKLILK
ncbi:MAG: NACHT domain-containing NTPase [Xenococcaceae cyanobacterium MO_234.B1]|nr:NACHT domain-containing NTPase [Xenococcaceae cyanobacterium MO_234.B1]